MAAACTEGHVRLVGDEEFDNNEVIDGRVEVCVGGRYGGVCDDYWDSADASVVCRERGLSPYGEPMQFCYVQLINCLCFQEPLLCLVTFISLTPLFPC